MEKYGLVRAGWPVLAFVVLGIAGCSKGPEHSATELHFDLRGQPLPAAFRTFGRMSNEDIRPEPDGLRIALPKDRPGQFMGGLDLVTKLTGDCEITAAVELLEAERPKTDEPSRVGVFLAANQAARVGQLMEMNESDMVWERFTAPDGTKAYIGGGEPSSEKLRRLRLRRAGSVMHFLWSSATDGEDFREIGECEFGTREITLVRLRIEKGSQVGRLGVRFADLRIGGPSISLGRPPWVTLAIGATAGFVIVAALIIVRRRNRKKLLAI